MTAGRPSAPWAILDVDLSAPPVALEAPEGVSAVLVLFRLGGVPLGKVRLLAGELPMGPGEVMRLGSRCIAHAVTERLRLAEALEPGGAVLRLLAGTPGTDADPLGRVAALLDAVRQRDTGRTASIVICSRHRAADLAACLDSIADEIAAGREVIVVDNGPDAATEAAVAARPGVRYVVERRPGLSQARNAGLRAARGDVVVFVDDDVRPEPGWITPLLAAFDAPDIAVVCGLALPAELRADAQVAFEFDMGFGGMGFVPRRFDAEFLTGWRWGPPVWEIGAGANMAIDRRHALAVGGFDERIAPGEDSEFWRRILHAGLVARYEPLSVVRHIHRRDFAALERQSYGYAWGHLAALFAQYAYARDRSELARALLFVPWWSVKELARALPPWRPAHRRRIAWAWLRGVVRGLGFMPFAWSRPWAETPAAATATAVVAA